MSKQEFNQDFSKKEILQFIEDLNDLNTIDDDDKNKGIEEGNIIEAFEILNKYSKGHIAKKDYIELQSKEFRREGIPFILRKDIKRGKQLL